MSFVLGKKDEVLPLSAEDSQHLHWHADTAFGVHPEIRINAGIKFIIGFWKMLSSSTKQKLNSRSSMEVKLIA